MNNRGSTTNSQQLSKKGTIIATIAIIGIMLMAIVIGVILFAGKGTKTSSQPPAPAYSYTPTSREIEESNMKEKQKKYVEMVQVVGATCKRGKEGVPEITVTYNFYNNTALPASFAGTFSDEVKYEFEYCMCLDTDSNFEKVIQPGESIQTNVVYEGHGTIAGFLEITLKDLYGKEQYLWKTFQLK